MAATAMTPPLAFYCVSSDLYFPGAVALVNSLRLVGHREPIFLCGAGLRDWQRELIAPEATVVDGPPDAPPYLLKTIAPRAHPARTMVLIDADMIATRPLTPLAQAAASGRVVAVRDTIDRFVEEWGELLDLGPIERRPYVSSGLVVLGGQPGAEVLELWGDRMQRVDFERSWFGRDEDDYPFRFIDQDVLNAVLGSRPAGEVEAMDRGLAPTPPFDGVRLVDPRTAKCALAGGGEPYVLHHFHRKPWLAAMRSSVYSTLLTRMLLSDDLPLRLEPWELPVRLRRGAPGGAARLATDLALIPAGLARRARERRTGGALEPWAGDR